MKIIVILSALLFVIIGVGPAFAEVIYLKDGRTVTGGILAETAYSVKVNVNGTTTVYYRSEIARIEKEAPPAAATPAVPATAQQPTAVKAPEISSSQKKELVRRLLVANGARDNMLRIFEKLIAAAPADSQEKLRKVLVTDEIIGELAPIYEKYYTEAELKELVVFYSGPTGQKLITAGPQIVQESIQVASDFFKKKVDEVDKGRK